eukprot:GFYU01012763.1.p1 GENE.GFYU01012763.1~~GFYU01012763.1.p1  ORF type:complete len:440 (-),score=112.88 GFYU01012763.1:74-1393(-)
MTHPVLRGNTRLCVAVIASAVILCSTLAIAASSESKAKEYGRENWGRLEKDVNWDKRLRQLEDLESSSWKFNHEYDPSNREAKSQSQFVNMKRQVLPVSGFQEIDRRSNLSYTDFILEYVIPRKPVIITDAMKDYAALDKWTFDWFSDMFGDGTASVQLGNSDTTVLKPVSWFLQYLKDNGDNVPMYAEFDTYYLGPSAGGLMADIGIPKYFANDWYIRCTNTAHEKITPRAFYFGGRGSGINNHQDNWSSHVYSMQIRGRKRWRLHSPDQGPFVYYGEVDTFAPDLKKYPLYRYARPIDFVLEAGEILYWPPGWWHQTLVIEDSIGFSENFINFWNFQDFNSFYQEACKNYITRRMAEDDEGADIEDEDNDDDESDDHCEYIFECHDDLTAMFENGPLPEEIMECKRPSEHHYCYVNDDVITGGEAAEAWERMMKEEL